MNDQKEKIIIGFDMDGVIVNNTQPKIRLAKALGFKLLPEQTPSEIISKHLPLLVLRELQRNLYDNIETALTTPLMRGARRSDCGEEIRFPLFPDIPPADSPHRPGDTKKTRSLAVLFR